MNVKQNITLEGENYAAVSVPCSTYIRPVVVFSCYKEKALNFRKVFRRIFGLPVILSSLSMTCLQESMLILRRW
jgi:ABC-type sugar transport system permease subunit